MITTNNLLSGHNFNGLGPILSLEGRYPLGNSGLALLASARGGLLFGSGSEQATNTILSLDPTNGNAIVGQTAIQATRSVRGVMPFAEFELGAEWGRKIGIYQLSLQTALVGQVWQRWKPCQPREHLLVGGSPTDDGLPGHLGTGRVPARRKLIVLTFVNKRRLSLRERRSMVAFRSELLKNGDWLRQSVRRTARLTAT